MGLQGFTFNGLEFYISYDPDKQRKPSVKIGDAGMSLEDFKEFLLTAYHFCPQAFEDLPVKEK